MQFTAQPEGSFGTVQVLETLTRA